MYFVQLISHCTDLCGCFWFVSAFSDSVSVSSWYPLWTSYSIRSKLLVRTGVSFMPARSITMCSCYSSVALESHKGNNNDDDYDDDSTASSPDAATAGVLSGLWSSAVSLGWVQPWLSLLECCHLHLRHLTITSLTADRHVFVYLFQRVYEFLSVWDGNRTHQLRIYDDAIRVWVRHYDRPYLGHKTYRKETDCSSSEDATGGKTRYKYRNNSPSIVALVTIATLDL